MVESDRLSLIASITSSYLRRNSVSVDQIGTVVSAVTAALDEASSNQPAAVASGNGSQPVTIAEKAQPAVSIKKSVQPEYIVCLEDGFKAKTMKRHLQTAHGMTPQDYREKWKLPSDYPIVAPAYSERRSTMAKSLGLGRKAGETRTTAPKRRSDTASSSRAKTKAGK